MRDLEKVQVDDLRLVVKRENTAVYWAVIHTKRDRVLVRNSFFAPEDLTDSEVVKMAAEIADTLGLPQFKKGRSTEGLQSFKTILEEN